MLSLESLPFGNVLLAVSSCWSMSVCNLYVSVVYVHVCVCVCVCVCVYIVS